MKSTFNPLGDVGAQALAAALKQRVRNIIRSYNHPADLLAEPLQNAVDEIEEAVREKAIERGQIVVTISCTDGKIMVRDNGRGITWENVQKLLAPDVTQKAILFRNGRSRGHKGVGLTFLAYGFNYFELESRTTEEHYRVRIDNAREWIEDSSRIDPPMANIDDLEDHEGRLRKPGTVITVQVGEQTEPRSLPRTFVNPEYAQTVLETQTAIGVYPDANGAETPFDATLDYRAPDGTLTSRDLNTIYRFPHLALKRGVKTIDVGKYLDGSPSTAVPARLAKKHESAYRHYSTDMLSRLLQGQATKSPGDHLIDDNDVQNVLTKHKVRAYALAAYGASYKETLSQSWSVPKNRTLIAPSVRIATDSMISSWRRDLALSHRGFNVERIWLVVHLENVEPDLGRKDYPPQIRELIQLMENPVADDIAKQATPFLIPTSTSGHAIDYEEPLAKAGQHRQKPFPITLPNGSPQLRYLTEPQTEQDVVALFNELRGLGILPFFSPVFFSGSYVYDSYLEYDPEQIPEVINRHFEPSASNLPKRLREGVAEFKFRAVEILPDLVKEIKQWNDIRWLVCWDADKGTMTQGGLTIDITSADYDESMYAAITHVATLSSAGESTLPVIALKSLLQKLATRSAE